MRITKKNHNQDSPFSCQDSNQATPEYDSDK